MAEKIDSHDPRVDERMHRILNNEYSAKALTLDQYLAIARRAAEELNRESASAPAV